MNILPWACAGLLVGGPVSVAVAGFLFAKGDAATVLRGAVLHTCASLVFGLALLPVMGVTALGMSVFASAVVEGIVLGARASREYEIRIVKPLVIPTLMSVIAGTIGWITAEHVAPVALGAVAGGTRGPRRLCPGRMGTESTCAQRHCQYGDAISSIGGRLMCVARTCLRRAGDVLSDAGIVARAVQAERRGQRARDKAAAMFSPRLREFVSALPGGAW